MIYTDQLSSRQAEAIKSFPADQKRYTEAHDLGVHPATLASLVSMGVVTYVMHVSSLRERDRRAYRLTTRGLNLRFRLTGRAR